MAETWLVTGTNRGIGLALVRQLKLHGEHVIATCRNPDAISELRIECDRAECLDVANKDSITQLSRVLDRVPIDVLVNNAGVGVGGRDFVDEDWDLLDSFFQVNAIAPMRLAKALLPNLRLGRRKLIVNISTIMASISDLADGGAYGYRSSKAALNMLTRVMAIDLRLQGYTCIAMHPGWVATRMGGPNGEFFPAESAARILATLSSVTPERTGEFLDLHGDSIPW